MCTNAEASRRTSNAIGACRSAASRPEPGLPALEQFEALAKVSSKRSGSLHQSRGFGAGHRSHRESAAPSGTGCRPRRLPSDRDQPVRSCALAGGAMERERRRHDQLRAAHLLHAEIGRTARRGFAGLADHCALCRGDGIRRRRSPTPSAEEIFAEFAALTKNTVCDYSGVSYPET